MFERGLLEEDIAAVIKSGEIVMDYPDDRPYPSQLRLGWVHQKAVHIVVSRDIQRRACYVITAYYPSLEIWHDDFKIRRQK
jgi:hypothetical protein